MKKGMFLNNFCASFLAQIITETGSLNWFFAVFCLEKEKAPILATGFSCRSQVERMEGKKPLHPAEYLLTLL